MIETTEQVLDAIEDGRMTRREAVARLLTAAAATFAVPGLAGPGIAADAQVGPTFRTTGLDHIALRVTDIPRSRDFYVRHLGLRVTSESASSCFLRSGQDHFVALFRSDAAGMDHYAYRIDDYDAGDVVARLEAAGLSPRRVANRVYFDDPDGLEVQIS